MRLTVEQIDTLQALSMEYRWNGDVVLGTVPRGNAIVAVPPTTRGWDQVTIEQDGRIDSLTMCNGEVAA
jgi:hypothetical protein